MPAEIICAGPGPALAKGARRLSFEHVCTGIMRKLDAGVASYRSAQLGVSGACSRVPLQTMPPRLPIVRLP